MYLFLFMLSAARDIWELFEMQYLQLKEKILLYNLLCDFVHRHHRLIFIVIFETSDLLSGKQCLKAKVYQILHFYCGRITNSLIKVYVLYDFLVFVLHSKL